MTDVHLEGLEQIAVDAARAYAGPQAFGGVHIEPELDHYDELAYRFLFRIDRKKINMPLGLLQVRLLQRLADELAARGDASHRYIRLAAWPDQEKQAGEPAV